MTGLNLISESVAAGLWCPFARVSSPADEPAYNRLGSGREQGQQVEALMSPRMARCLGSKCAAWRWNENGGLELSLGYCGAAGPP